MAEAIRHRGPDGEGYLIKGPVGLGHRRLAIIDLESGQQPLGNEDDSVSIVFNGEIYNYRTLRAELAQKGHTLRTQSDTETIVHLYEEYGPRCVQHLRGMFAFALWDAPRQRLLLARDRLGQKPLFYTRQQDRFLFASEVKGLFASGAVTPELDEQALHSYLALRFVPSPKTMFEGVFALPPGHILVLEGGKCHIERYWEPSYGPKWEEGEDALTDRLDELVQDAVQSHLVSDVRLGTFLSGGIDSSLMTALAATRVDGRLPTFSIGSTSVDFNELPLARTVAHQYNTEHHEEIAQPDLVTLLPEMVYHLDMPGDPIAACQYHVARLAASHVKVAIGGDGGDELFGGYDRFVGFGLIDYYAALPRSLRSRVIGPLLDRLVDSATYKSSVAKVRWMHALSFSRGGERYADATAYFRFDRSGLANLYGPELNARLSGVDPRLPIIHAFDAVEEGEALDRMLHADVTTRLPEHLLILFDRMTMAQSMEGRSPLLDHEVAEFAARLPVNLKIKGRRLKYLLRRVAERHVPEAITNAPKRGFMFPIAYWLKSELRDVTRHLLLEDSKFVERGFFRRDALERLLAEHQSGLADHHHRIWMLVNLEVWHRLFIEGQGIDAVSEDLRAMASPRPLATV